MTHTLEERAAQAGWLCALFVRKPGAWGTVPHPWTSTTPPLGALLRLPPPTLLVVSLILGDEGPTPRLCYGRHLCAGRRTRQSHAAAGGCGGYRGFLG